MGTFAFAVGVNKDKKYYIKTKTQGWKTWKIMGFLTHLLLFLLLLFFHRRSFVGICLVDLW